MRTSTAALPLLLALSGGWSYADDLTVTVADTRGRPVADAVVTAPPTEAPAGAAAAQPPRTHTIDQRDETFIPYVEVFRPGDSVVFTNSDVTRHHAYSFAPAKTFEFQLRPGEQSDPLPLLRTGVVSVGCNIHDRMITHLFVTDAPWAIRTGPDGTATFPGLEPGTYRLVVWHPQLRPGYAGTARDAVVGGAGGPQPVAYALPLIADPRGATDRERAPY